MGGETDLGVMLATLDVRRRDGVFVYAQIPPRAAVGGEIQAMIAEEGATTVVLRAEDAARAGLDSTFPCAWLTLTVRSSLQAVGLTAAFSAALTAAGVSCNVLAGHDHDHILVPVDRVDDAIAALRRLRADADGR